jgi:RimJ/RimL family protein N-acetyltransferase
MIKLLPFKRGHLDLLETRQCFSGDESVIERTEELASHPGVYAHTILLDGMPIGVFGGYLIWGRVYGIYALFSDEVRKRPVAFYKACYRAIETYWKALKADRFEMKVRADFFEGKRFAESLGFKKEGILVKGGPEGADYVLYAKVRGED